MLLHSLAAVTRYDDRTTHTRKPFLKTCEYGKKKNACRYCVNTALNACGKAGRIQEALELMEDARASGIELDVVSYNCAIPACVVGGKWEQALSMVREMRTEYGIEPNHITYQAVIKVCAPHRRTSRTRMRAFRFGQAGCVSSRDFVPGLWVLCFIAVSFVCLFVACGVVRRGSRCNVVGGLFCITPSLVLTRSLWFSLDCFRSAAYHATVWARCRPQIISVHLGLQSKRHSRWKPGVFGSRRSLRFCVVRVASTLATKL